MSARSIKTMKSVLFEFPYVCRTALFTSDGVYPYLSKYLSASDLLTPLAFKEVV